MSAYLPPLQSLVSDLGDREDFTPEPTKGERALLSEYRDFLSSRRLAATSVRLRSFWAGKLAEYLASRGVPLIETTVSELDDYIYSNPAWSSATQVTILATIRSFYGWAFRRGHTVADPSRDLYSIRAQRRPARIASDEAIRTGLARGTVAERVMILLGAECGLRVAEIASLHRSDRQGEWLMVTGKGNKTRSVWISPELHSLLNELESRPARQGFYFPGKSGSHMHPSTIWRHIQATVITNPHSLRHRAGTVVYRGTGFDIRAAQEFLGHASPTTTAGYVHVEQEDLRKAGRAAQIH